MQEYLANKVKALLENVTWLERLGGLTQTLEETRHISDTVKETLRYPVTRDVNETLAPGAYAAMLPDRKYKGFCYFETGAFDFGALRGSWLEFTGRLRLVVWCNMAAYEVTNSALQADVLRALLEPVKNCGTAYIHTLRPLKILETEDGIFKRYNYDPNSSQLFIFPYYAFAVDLELTGRFNVKGEGLGQFDLSHNGSFK
jgi:hypothetical protein